MSEAANEKSLSDILTDAVQKGRIVSLNLDFDGTLGGHAANPFDARATKESLEAVLAFLRIEQKLNESGVADTGRIEVSFITGRQFSTLKNGLTMESEEARANPIEYLNGLKELLTQSIREHLPANEQPEAEALIAGLSCDHFHGMLSRDRNGVETGPKLNKADDEFVAVLKNRLNELYEKYEQQGHDFRCCHEGSPYGAVVNYRAFLEGEGKGMKEDNATMVAFRNFQTEAKAILQGMVTDENLNPKVVRPGGTQAVDSFAIHHEAMADEIRINGFGNKGTAIRTRYQDTKARWPERDVVVVWAGDSLRNKACKTGTDYPAFLAVNQDTPPGDGIGIQVLDKQKAENSSQVPLLGDPASPAMIFDTPDQFGIELQDAAKAYEHYIAAAMHASKPASRVSEPNAHVPSQNILNPGGDKSLGS